MSLVPQIVENKNKTVHGQWSNIEYTRAITAGYPEYYPVIITLRSNGHLPKDIMQYTNYTGPIFIEYFEITAPNIPSFDPIQKKRDSDELIGTYGLELTFTFELSDLQNQEKINFEILLRPDNFTQYLNNDLYNFQITVNYEGDGNDFLLASVASILPAVLIIGYIIAYKRSRKHGIYSKSFFTFWIKRGRRIRRRQRRITNVRKTKKSKKKKHSTESWH